MAISVGRVGIWSMSMLWHGSEAAEAAAELDELGFGTLWLGVADADLRVPTDVLEATTHVVVASAIVNIWTVKAAELATSHHEIESAHPGRFLLGLGVSHEPAVTALGQRYERPLTRFAEFLDDLDAAEPPVPVGERILAALGPKALSLAGERSAGAHPYLVTPAYTARARERLGPDPLLAPEQKVILDTDPTSARRTARAHLAFYLSLPNYVRNLLAHGFTADDVAGEGSDWLVDALYAHGTPEQVAARVAEHRAAGADHVAVHVVTPDPGRLPREQWQALAAVLL